MFKIKPKYINAEDLELYTGDGEKKIKTEVIEKLKNEPVIEPSIMTVEKLKVENINNILKDEPKKEKIIIKEKSIQKPKKDDIFKNELGGEAFHYKGEDIPWIGDF